MTAVSEAVQIASHLDQLAGELLQARLAAHAKHGDNSIERTAPGDIGRWLSILGEEFGEICRALTYDQDGDLRGELVDLLAVASAWVQSIDDVPELLETDAEGVVEATIYCGAECDLPEGHSGRHATTSGAGR